MKEKTVKIKFTDFECNLIINGITLHNSITGCDHQHMKETGVKPLKFTVV